MKNNTIITLAVFGILVFPALALAQPVFRPLVGIPGIEDPSVNFNTYINTIYAMSIAIAALLAVIKIIIAGVKWMLSDIVTSKQEAKSEIQGALLGLLIIASAFLILNEINPNLTKTKLVTSKVDRPSSYQTAPKTSTPPVGGTTTTRPPTTNMAGVPTGEDQWVEMGVEEPVVLPLNPSRPPTSMNCSANDVQCASQFGQTCIRDGGQTVVAGGTVQCRYSRTMTISCDTPDPADGDRRVELPRTTTGTDGITTPEYRDERNCYPQLARCQDRTPEMQRTMWETGRVSCNVAY